MEEIRGSQPSGDDVVLVAKRFMADTDPVHVVVVLTAGQADALRQSFGQPRGVSPRRTIGAKVQKNLASKVQPCVRQGVLSLEAAAYLTNWIGGTLVQKPRPASYDFLRHRLWGGPVDGDGARWVAPVRRERHIDLSCHGEEVEYFSESEIEGDHAEGKVDLALAENWKNRLFWPCILSRKPETV